MIQFAIVIPFRPKTESNNWIEESQLLNQTISSILRQTYHFLKIFVIYTDLPQDIIKDARVVYNVFPFQHHAYKEIAMHEELLSKFKSEKMVVRRWDKGRKLSYGCKIAKELGFDYIMALDADDRLSKNFFSYLVSKSPDGSCPGWFMEKGYIYKPPSFYFLRVPHGMRSLNGSTNILRSDLVQIPDFNSGDWQDYNLFTDHGWVKTRVKEYYNAEMESIEKPMLVYVVHDSNISNIKRKEYGFRFQAFIKRIIRFVPITKRLKEEFGI